MKVLLDTNVFLRWAFNERVPRKVERLITAKGSDLYISIVTPWEVAIKARQLRVKNLTKDHVGKALDLLGAQILPILLKHVDLLYSLPEHHRDPFDRLLIAQAISENALVLSSDERFPLYKSAGLQVRWET